MKETESLNYSSVRLISISLMNTQSCIFKSATLENTAFGVHSMKKINLTPKNSNIRTPKAVFSRVAFATLENTAVGVHSMKKINLTPKKSNILYVIFFSFQKS